MMMCHRFSARCHWIARRMPRSSGRLRPAILSIAVFAILLAANPPPPGDRVPRCDRLIPLHRCQKPEASSRNGIFDQHHRKSKRRQRQPGCHPHRRTHLRTIQLLPVGIRKRIGRHARRRTDPRHLRRRRYLLPGGQDGGKFNIDASGQLQTKGAVGDYENSETQKSYALTLTATADSDASLQHRPQ